MKKEPSDYLIDIIGWVLFTPMMLTCESQKKYIRILGRLLCFPFCITWVFTGLPILTIMLILMIAQLFYE